MLLAILCSRVYLFFFFFNGPATTEIYTLSLHDALPICRTVRLGDYRGRKAVVLYFYPKDDTPGCTKEACRSEEHMSELQSHSDLVCRLLLEKKKKKKREIEL